MKQPELGKKLVELRQLKGVTQQEVSEACNVSMRTIQRIELGQTEPRPMTLKLILDYLDEDYETFMGSAESEPGTSLKKTGYLTAAVAGGIYFILGLPEAYVDLNLMESFPAFGGKVFFTLVKLLVIASYLVFMNGFAKLGEQLNLKALTFTSYILMAVTTVFYLVWIGFVIAEVDGTFLLVGESLTMGTLSLFFGVSLYQLRGTLGDVVLGAVVLEVLIGVFLILVVSAFAAFLLLIPATLVEIYLLYSASVKSEAELSFS